MAALWLSSKRIPDAKGVPLRQIGDRLRHFSGCFQLLGPRLCAPVFIKTGDTPAALKPRLEVLVIGR